MKNLLVLWSRGTDSPGGRYPNRTNDNPTPITSSNSARSRSNNGTELGKVYDVHIYGILYKVAKITAVKEHFAVLVFIQ